MEDGFATANLKLAIFIIALKNKKKYYLINLTKSTRLIKKLVDKNLDPLFNDRSAAKIWIILENRFQYISPISVTRIILNIYSVRLLEYKDIINYTSRYQIAFVKLLSLLNNNT